MGRAVAALLCVVAGGCAAGMQSSNALGRVELAAAGREGDLSDRLLDGKDVALPKRARPFAERVKRAVAQDWRPDQLVRQRELDAALFDGSHRVIVVRVSLRPDGEVVDTHVARSCGIYYLDGEAEAVLRRTGPFRSPPPDLRDAAGLYHFSFGFLFALSRPPAPVR